MHIGGEGVARGYLKTGADGGEIRPEPVQPGRGGEGIPDGRCGQVAAGWEGRVPGRAMSR